MYIKLIQLRLAIGHLGISNNAMISLSEHQTIAYLIAQFPMPEATFIEPAVYGCNVLQVLIVYM